jgi:two-component system KDP operon response regulator KdpE
MDLPSILVVDDDPGIGPLLQSLFEIEGWETRTALTGENGLELFDAKLPDLTVLDIGLPGIDGFEVCRRITSRSSNPVIMLSARDAEDDKVKCLEIGADDYLTKPFKNKELVARVKVSFRHHQRGVHSAATATIAEGSITVDFRARQLKTDGRTIKLTGTECSLLAELLLNPGKVLEDSFLLKKVWGEQYGDEHNYLHVYINHLRSKIEPDPQNPKYILTIQGVGYKFANP